MEGELSRKAGPKKKKKHVLESSRVRDSSLSHAGGKGAWEGESRLRWVLEGFRQGFLKKMWWEENTRTSFEE